VYKWYTTTNAASSNDARGKKDKLGGTRMSYVYLFHGIDDKVGTTMLTLSVAEALADTYSDRKILYIALNGRSSLDYSRECGHNIDALKSRLESRILMASELDSVCGNIKNLFLLGGVENEDEERFFQPELAEFIIETAMKAFDVILVDSGNRLDNGLAFGALSFDAMRYFVLTQTENCLARWEKRKAVYEKLRIHPNAFILNKYTDKDIYHIDYVKTRLNLDRDFHRVRLSREGRRAEIEKKTLRYLDAAFKKDINKFTDLMVENMKVSFTPHVRRRGWRSFISNGIWQKA
jgi:hypothetical protein